MNNMTYQPYYLYEKEDIEIVRIPEIIDCDYNPNAYMMHRKIFDTVGYFDGKMFPIYWEETDFFKRANIVGISAKTVTSSRVWHDVPLDEYFHITDNRSYCRGKSRINFYKKYAKWRIFLSIADALYFAAFIAISRKVENKKSAVIYYIPGMFDGLISNNNVK